jgi:hypothetical protein
MVLFTSNNDNGILKKNNYRSEDIPYHSEIWATVYGPEVERAKLVGCPNVVSENAMSIIKDARAKLAPGRPNKEVVTISANSQRVERSICGVGGI